MRSVVLLRSISRLVIPSDFLCHPENWLLANPMELIAVLSAVVGDDSIA